MQAATDALTKAVEVVVRKTIGVDGSRVWSDQKKKVKIMAIDTVSVVL
jgi:hypothetical protein